MGVRFRFRVPGTDTHMAVRGVWKVAFDFGKRDAWICADFDSSEANPYVFTVPDSVRLDTSKSWEKLIPIPEIWRENGRWVYLSHAFIDSTGDISAAFVDSIRWVGLRLSAGFEDPHPWNCQESGIWSNSPDSLLVRVDTSETTWPQIDTLEVDYHWTPKQPDLVLLRPEADTFVVAMPVRLPVECEDSRITLVAKDRETGARTSYTGSLRFDFSVPQLSSLAVKDVGSRDLPLEYAALPGWTNRDTVIVSAQFEDNCSLAPLGYELRGDWRKEGWECSSDTVWPGVTSSGDGEKDLSLAVVDSAGNASQERSVVIRLDTKTPAFEFCKRSFRGTVVQGDSVRVKLQCQADDESALGGFAFSHDGSDWRVAAQVGLGQNQQTWDCSDTLVVGFNVTSDTFYVYGVAFDRAGNCSGIDSALVLVTRPPQVAVTVFDACDSEDSLYVNCPVVPCTGGATADSVLLHLSWKRVDSLVVEHGDQRRRVTVDRYTGSKVLPWTIQTRCAAVYWDSVTVLAYQLGQVGASTRYRFVVDHKPPAVLAVAAVAGPGSDEPVPYVSQPEVWVRVTAQDEGPGAIERFWCRAGHASGVYNLVPDDSTVQGDKAWYHFSLSADSTGWWYFGAKAWDAGNNASSVVEGKVDYRKGGAAFCYPNPFTPPDERVALSFVSNEEGTATIEIYDAFGFLVWKTSARVSKGVVDGAGPSGGVSWDGRNLAGDLVASGGYICRITTPDGRTETVKIGVVR